MAKTGLAWRLRICRLLPGPSHRKRVAAPIICTHICAHSTKTIAAPQVGIIWCIRMWACRMHFGCWLVFGVFCLLFFWLCLFLVCLCFCLLGLFCFCLVFCCRS